MVCFRANEEYFSKSMHAMNELRQNGKFCDITLFVGSQFLEAHRCVLAAGNSYFNVLFLGQFAEASMNDINLSEVTKDISALETMVNFLYTGEIDIDADNLETVVKLSSYFLMETVLEFCKVFIVKTLSLSTCLKYHLCAVNHGLTDIEDQTTPMVKNRFHDFIIYEEETLNISPKELMYLHDQNDVFQFCAPHVLLRFVVDWVENGLTEQHISVGTELLDSVGCVNNTSLTSMHVTEETLHAACEEMISNVRNAQPVGHEKFVHRVSELHHQCYRNRDNKIRYDLRGHSTDNIPTTSEDIGKEDVIITLSPKQCVLLNHFNTYNHFTGGKHSRPYTDPVLDMCAYVPRTRCWYYLKQTGDQLLHKIGLETLLDEYSVDRWIFTMRDDQLVFATGMGDACLILHTLKSGTCTWGRNEFDEELTQLLQDNEAWKNDQICIVSGANNTLYLITVIRCFEDEYCENCVAVYFRCFKYQDSEQSWKVFFQTKKYSSSKTDFQSDELQANISNVSNEMIVTYVDGGNRYRSIIFVVDISSETPAPVPIRDSFDVDTGIFRLTMAIVQGKEQFFILHDTQHDEGRFIQVKYEYRYHSNKLTKVETDKEKLGETEIIRGRIGNLYTHPPCLPELLISDQESVWYISGDKETMSSMTEVTVDRNRTPVITLHPPPPFTCITAAFAGKVTKDVLTEFSPVSYMGTKQEKHWGSDSGSDVINLSNKSINVRWGVDPSAEKV